MHQKQPSKPHSFEELKHLYEVEKLSVDQLYGQLLVWIEINHTLALANERHQEGYDRELVDLAAQVAELKKELSGNRITIQGGSSRTKNRTPQHPIPGQKWAKLPWKDIFTLWARRELGHSKAIDQLLLWGEDTHELTSVCSETQSVIVEEQRALAQDHEILLQKYEALAEEHAVLAERVRLLERR